MCEYINRTQFVIEKKFKDINVNDDMTVSDFVKHVSDKLALQQGNLCIKSSPGKNKPIIKSNATIKTLKENWKK